MKSWALAHLRCPQCLTTLKSEPFQENAIGETISGVLVCCAMSCRAWYPIVRGIPRMLPRSLREELTEEFVQEYRGAFQAKGLIDAETSSNGDKLHKLKQQTIRNFGFEWLEFSRFGWDDPVYNIRFEEKVFRRKALLEPETLEGKLALDAGCGNGRYTYWAAKLGARVFGMDLGDGVESASKNLAEFPNVQIVQGDIFHPPFEPATFDVIFSIGVLMHTGNAREATASLAGKLRPQGSLTVHLYGKGNPIYEYMDRVIRARTVRMSITELQEFTAKAYRLRQRLETLRLAKQVSRFIRIDRHPHCIFDWYAAPIATHHTYDEVKMWFKKTGLTVVATNEPQAAPKSIFRKFVRAIIHGQPVVTVRGTRDS